MTAEQSRDQHRPESSGSKKIYYVLKDSKPVGPYSIRELVRMRNDKEVTLETPCCIEGAKDWQPLEVLITHKMGQRKFKKVARGSFSSFSRRTAPTLVFAAIGMLSLAMGVAIAIRRMQGMEFVGYGLVGLAFILFVGAYFVHPKTEK